MRITINQINKNLLFFLAFIFPLFFLPFSVDKIFYPKKSLFFGIVTVSFLLWFLENFLYKKKLILRWHSTFSLLFFLFLFFFFLSTIFSVSRNISLWGFPLEINDSFSFFFFSSIFLFLFVNSFDEKIDLKVFYLFLLLSSFFLSVFFLLELIIQRPILGVEIWNLLGGIASSSIFFAILIPLSLSLFFETKPPLKIFFGILAILFFFIVLILNVKFVFLLLFLMLLFFSFFLIEKHFETIERKKIIILFSLSFIALFFYFFPINLNIFPLLPGEVSLSFSLQIPIIKHVTFQNLKNFLLGTGPGTFALFYSKFRPLSVNETIFWGTRFSRGTSVALDWLITKGFLCTFFLFSVCLFSLGLLLREILKKRSKTSFFEIGIFSAEFGLFLALFFYSFNIVNWFLFWILLGSGLLISFHKRVEIDFSFLPILKPSFFLISFLIFTSCLIFTGFQMQKYLANIYYRKAILTSQENLDLSITYIKKAKDYDPQTDLYFRELAQFLLFKANQLAIREDISLEEKRREIDQLIREGIEAIEKAIAILPENVANWNVRGFFYRNLIGIQGAEELALDSYKKATMLEPNSPYSFTEMARVYLLISQQFFQKGQLDAQKEVISLARAKLEEALQKKPDYAPAHYLMAVAFSQEGKQAEAISKLEETLALNPNDLGVAFQLSLLYYRINNFEKAKHILERIIQNFPNYSNARYLLGLIYDKENKKEKAKREFQAVLQLNPDNEEVKKILENLEKGLPALEGIIIPTTLPQVTPVDLQP